MIVPHKQGSKQMTSSIQWETPPAPRRGREVQDHSAFAETLRSRPSQWARDPRVFPSKSTAYTAAASICHGRAKAFRPAGTFEAVTRTIDGESVVYARFVGDKS